MRSTLLSLLISIYPGHSLANHFDSVKEIVHKEVSLLNFKVGVSVLHLESGKSFSINGTERTPMASVYKFPIGLVLLKMVEDGKILINEAVSLEASDIRGGHTGPIARKFPNGGVTLSISQLLKYMVADSDNSASDLLLKRIGGPKVATRVLHDWGFRNISIDRYEKSLIQDSENSKNQGLDTASANELVRIMQRFFRSELLSIKNTKILKELMTSLKTPGHIAKGLPKGTSQFHKSGWCPKNRCINDVALVTLPKNKGHLAVAVLTSGDIENTNTASKFIGRVSRIAFDSFVE